MVRVVPEGRVAFGIGYGWNEDEMAHHGTVFETRFKKMVEQVRAMKEIWTKDVAEFHGEHVDLPRLRTVGVNVVGLTIATRFESGSAVVEVGDLGVGVGAAVGLHRGDLLGRARLRQRPAARPAKRRLPPRNPAKARG